MMYSTTDIENIIANMKCKLGSCVADLINKESLGIFKSWNSMIYISEAIEYLEQYLDDSLCYMTEADIVNIINKLKQLY